MNKIKLTTTRLLVGAFLLCGLMIIQTPAAPGDLDPSFGNGGIVRSTDFGGNAIAIQSDGKIVAAGVVFPPTGAFVFSVSRYNADGSLDATFGSGGRVITGIGNLGYPYATAVAIQPDGKIIAGGSNDLYGDSTHNFLLARYNTDGSLDSTFGTGGKVVTPFNVNGEAGLTAIAIQSDGKIVAAGSSGGYYTSPDFLLARYNTNGSLDTSFGSGGIIANAFGSGSYARDVAIQSDGKIVAAGASVNSFALARYNINGSLDTSFGTGGKILTNFNSNAAAFEVAIQSNGKIVAAGTDSDGTNSNFALSRYNTDGSLDNSFGSGGKVITTFSNGSGYAQAAAIQSDGKIVAVGSSGDFPNSGFTAVRYNTDGSLDLTFGSGGKVVTQISDNIDYANAVAIQSDGKIVAAGNVYPSNGGFGRSAMIRYQGRPEAGLTVTRSDDRNNGVCVPGDCSLREAVNAANASGGDDTINFASGLTTITLTNEIVINNAGALTINGLGANILTIDGGAGTNRIFYVDRSTVTISSVTLTGGNGTGAFFSGEGGAILDSFSVLTLDGVHVTGNSSSSVGGGLYSREGRCLIINSTISGNTAGSSGGGFGRIYFSSSSSMTVVNSTISGNTAPYNGGGIYTTGDTTLRNVTITNNAAQRGGGIFLVGDEDLPGSSRVNFGNTIVAGNNATNGIGPEISFVYGSIISAGGNLVGDSPGDSPNSINYQPTDIRDTNPLLGALQNNGGSTPTHVLLAGSPIIDKGLNNLISPLASAFDQRGAGFARIRDGNGDNIPTVDIGTFEVQLGATAVRQTPFDFDGDGKADLSVFRPSNQTWYLNRSQAGFSAVQFGLSTDKLTPADFDGDGKTDIAVFRDGIWYWLNSSNGSFNQIQFGVAGDIPVAADFSGDGRAELAVYRGGTWWTFNLSNNQVNTNQFGISPDKPVVADYDGDGKADQAVYRNGEWHLNRSTQGYSVVNFGLATDKAVPADYDGDGKTDEAVYRNGTWYVLQSSQGFTAFQFGLSNDVPAPADYDGDSKTDTAVFRDGTWWILQSTSGVTIQQFGLANDKPVPAAFSP